VGIEALAIVDRNSVAGIVRAHEAAKVTGVRMIVGCRLDLMDGSGVLVYPTDRPAYARLCRLLSLGKRRAGKAKCNLDWPDLPDFAEGLIAVLVPDQADEVCAQRVRRLKATFPIGAYLGLSLRRRPGDAMRLHDLSNLAAQAGVPDRRHQRRAVSPSRAPAAAGRGHLRASRLHHRRTRLPARNATPTAT
jgi:error-prone DNA polymerase